MNYRTRVAVVYLLGFFIDLINMFISNVAYPAISRSFHASVEQMAWVSNGYILGLTLIIPASRWMATRLGSKLLFLLSVATFIIATWGAGSAENLGTLIGWRVLQGLGGGLLIPIGQTLVYSLYPANQRARLSAIIMLVGLLAPATSPALGGVIADHFGWRWVFFASIPLATLTLILAALWLERDTDEKVAARLDIIGLLTSCTALALILLGLTELGSPEDKLQGSELLLSGLLLLAVFVHQSLRKTNPLLNLRLLQQPLLRTSMLIYQLIPGVFTGVSLLTMLYLQNILLMSATAVGELMLPWALAAFFAISLTGKQFNRLGPRPLFIVGCLVTGCGIAMLALVVDAEQRWVQILSFALMGFGSSLCSSTAQSAAYIDIADTQLSDASALWNINRQLSFCFGITAMSLLFNFLAQMSHEPSAMVYRSSFAIAALIALLPIALCLRLDNRALIAKLSP